METRMVTRTWGNMPRIDPQTGYGIVTDVCLKRKIRDYVDLVKGDVSPYRIYVKTGVALNTKHEEAYKHLGIKPDKSKPKDAELTKFMCQNFFDIRTFGAVMNTEVNCGQVRGPVQINFFPESGSHFFSRKLPLPARQ